MLPRVCATVSFSFSTEKSLLLTFAAVCARWGQWRVSYPHKKLAGARIWSSTVCIFHFHFIWCAMLSQLVFCLFALLLFSLLLIRDKIWKEVCWSQSCWKLLQSEAVPLPWQSSTTIHAFTRRCINHRSLISCSCWRNLRTIPSNSTTPLWRCSIGSLPRTAATPQFFSIRFDTFQDLSFI